MGECRPPDSLLSFKQEAIIIDLNSIETHLVINDLHSPYYHKEILDLVLRFGKDLKPDALDILGDMADCPSISKFDDSPLRDTTIRDDLNAGYEANTKIFEVFKKAKKRYVKGNHEDRYPKYIFSNKKLYGLIDFDKEIGLKEHDVAIYEYGEKFETNGFYFMHGDSARKYSAYTAKNHLSDMGVSGMCGHTHRAGAHYKTDYSGEKVFLENGCLCSFDLSKYWFRKPLPDWQMAISVIKFVDDKFHVDQIIIPNKHPFIIYGDKYYTL
jgi:predicted phosphodiesterase